MGRSVAAVALTLACWGANCRGVRSDRLGGPAPSVSAAEGARIHVSDSGGATDDAGPDGGPRNSPPGPTHGGPIGPVTGLFERGGRACAVEEQTRVWCWDSGESEASLDACATRLIEQVSFDDFPTCPACMREQGGRVACWTMDSHLSFFLPITATAKDVQVDNSIAGKLFGACAAVVLSTTGALFEVFLDPREGLPPQLTGPDDDLGLPAPARSAVAHHGSICASLIDGRVWCKLTLDLLPQRTHTFGEEPPFEALVPELRGATDLDIDDLCVSGALRGGHRRQVCLATMRARFQEIEVTYRRVVREGTPSARRQAPLCRVKPDGTVACGTPGNGTVTIERGARSAGQCL